MPGLLYYREFFNPIQQEELLQFLYKQPWQKVIARRQQFYGECYYHTNYKDPKLQPDILDCANSNPSTHTDLQSSAPTPTLPLDELRSHLQRCKSFFGEEQGFPSQVLVNEYRNNLGIASHFEDFDAFGDIILTISLVSPLYMTLKKPKVRNNECTEYHDVRKILLEPGSLLVMKHAARFEYRHGISKYKWIRNLPHGQPDMFRGESYRRVSITLRHLKETRRQVTPHQDESSGWRYKLDSPEMKNRQLGSHPSN